MSASARRKMRARSRPGVAAHAGSAADAELMAARASSREASATWARGSPVAGLETVKVFAAARHAPPIQREVLGLSLIPKSSPAGACRRRAARTGPDVPDFLDTPDRRRYIRAPALAPAHRSEHRSARGRPSPPSSEANS